MTDPLGWSGDIFDDNYENRNDQQRSNVEDVNNVIDDDQGTSSHIFGASLDFSSAGRTCQWPSYERAMDVKHFRLKRKI